MIAFFPSRTVALEIFTFQVYWYGVLYVTAFALAWWLLPRLQKYRQLQLTRDDWLLVLTAGVCGVLVGGRLGYVVLYEPVYFLRSWWEIPMLWHGGMSFHGGLVGVGIALWYVGKKIPVNMWSLLDIATVPIAIGLALGRIGNFINEELYGTVTTLPWGTVFTGVEGARHPTQLYAVGKDLLIAGIAYWHLRVVPGNLSGRTAAYFLLLYGTLRCMVEFFRDQEYGLISIGIATLTRGQLYTIPVIFGGVWLWYRTRPRVFPHVSSL